MMENFEFRNLLNSDLFTIKNQQKSGGIFKSATVANYKSCV